MENIQNTPNENNIIALFKEGFTLVFKKWSTFRVALDYTPGLLTQYLDDERTTLEINNMLEMVLEDIYNELLKERSNRTVMNVADILLSFIQEFFDVLMEDLSEENVAKCLIKLYDQVISGNLEYLERLRELDGKTNYANYSIEFPITGKFNEKMLAKEFEDKMDVDSEEEGEVEECEDEDEDMKIDSNNNNLNNTRNNTTNNYNNKTVSNSNEPDEEGFVVVKKGKKY